MLCTSIFACNSCLLSNWIKQNRKLPIICIHFDIPHCILTEETKQISIALHNQVIPSDWIKQMICLIYRFFSILNHSMKMFLFSINVEKILKGSLDSIPSPSVKIQIMDGKVCFRCKGKTLLCIANNFWKKMSVAVTQQFFA